jgi:RNA polymerase sigma-70 factor (ECF subfamily)
MQTFFEHTVTVSPDSHSELPLEPSRWVEKYGDVLYRYALIRVGRHEIAEDLVQETLLAALQARDRFAGRSTEQTWLIGILSHKIVDYFREKSRQQSVEVEDQTEAFPEGQFNKRGMWIAELGRWPIDPSRILESRDFWAVFEKCLSKLDPSLLAAFSLREFDRLTTEEICNTLEISPTNLGVRLYRARAALRSCLEANWFEGEGL